MFLKVSSRNSWINDTLTNHHKGKPLDTEEREKKATSQIDFHIAKTPEKFIGWKRKGHKRDKIFIVTIDEIKNNKVRKQNEPTSKGKKKGKNSSFESNN